MPTGEARQWLAMKSGITVHRVGLKGSWPETTLVVSFRLEQLPGCEFVWHRPLWSETTKDQAAPQYDEFLSVHLDEHVAKYLSRWRRECGPGEVLDVGVVNRLPGR
jgi:hypothetical protein